jgi:hypothetical protein
MQQWWPSAASYCSWSLRSLCLFDWRCGCRDHTRERERERSGEERSGKRHLYLSLISSFRLTQMFISSNSCSLSLSLSVLPSLSASNKPHHEKRPSSFSLHSPFLRPFRNIPFACSISSPLSLSLSTYTLQCKPRARRQASKTRGTEVAVAAGSGPSAT